MIKAKYSAGSLQLTLFIIIVIALLLTAFILLVFTHKQLKQQADFIIETTRISDEGIAYAMKYNIPLNDTVTVDVRGSEQKTLQIHRDFWGVFEKITTVAKIKNFRFRKSALIGSKQSQKNRLALFVCDNNIPLVLVGQTRIEGNAQIPEQGVKPGTMSGQSYTGSQLIYGQTTTSSRLPKISKDTHSQLLLLEDNLISNANYLDPKIGEDLSNSFLSSLQIIYSNSEIDLQKIKLTGHIIVHSKKKITIHSSSKLRDVLLIAPQINILDNVKGKFQAIASETIKVGQFVQLDYPSALVVTDKQVFEPSESLNQFTEQNQIVINDNSRINGVVMYLGDQSPNDFNAQIKLLNNSVVNGELYCSQNLELKGSVFGTVYTNNFISNEFGSIYQNHVFNGYININELSHEYVGLSFNDSKRSVLKWLY